MSDIHAYSIDGVAAGATPQPQVAARRSAAAISVEIADAARLPDLREAWTSLLVNAAAHNVFMDPALLQAMGESDPATQCWVLLAWRMLEGVRRLVGVWAFAVSRPPRSVLPVRVLASPVSAHTYLSTPVVDRSCLDETLDAMLDAVAADPRLGKVVALDMIATDDPTYDALQRVLAQRGSSTCTVEHMRRPKLASTLDGKAYLEQALSSSSRKKLRQYRRRLGEQGQLSSVVVAQPDEVARALEEFLAMEAAGWKGRQGTALLSTPADAAFMRAAVPALARAGRMAVHSLCLDGKPVSMQLIARCGGTAFTWKTAYDERFQDYSPGMLLFEDYTTALLADKTIASVDSCSFDDTSYMATWQERQPVAELWLDARRGRSLTFGALAGAHTTYRHARTMAKSAVQAAHKWRKARASAR